MGSYDTYGDAHIQIKAGSCNMHHYKEDDVCDIGDGLFLAPDGFVLVQGRVVLAARTWDDATLFDKWGSFIDPIKVLEGQPYARQMSEALSGLTVGTEDTSAAGTTD